MGRQCLKDKRGSESIFSLVRLTCVVVLAGCNGEPGAPDLQFNSDITLRDSSGVQIIENTGIVPMSDSIGLEDVRPLISEYSSTNVRPSHVLEIGDAYGDAPYLFSGIQSALRLSDGTFVIADSGARELRFFDDEGRFLHARGRQGRGPGEYEVLSGVWRMRGDTLLAFDPQLRRVTVAGPSGDYIRDWQLPNSGVVPAGALDDGTFVGIVNLAMQLNPAGYFRCRIAIGLYSEGTLTPDEVDGEFLGGELLSQESVAGLPGFGRLRASYARPIPYA